MCFYVGSPPLEAGTDGGDVKDSDKKSEIDVSDNFYVYVRLYPTSSNWLETTTAI